MRFSLRIAAVSAIAAALGATPAAHAQSSQPVHQRHPVAHRPLASGGDDVIVHTGRSYLEPGPGADVGTEDRYAYDTAHASSFSSEGPDFTRNTAGFELLPGPRDPPGQAEPLFVFETPGSVRGGR